MGYLNAPQRPLPNAAYERKLRRELALIKMHTMHTAEQEADEIRLTSELTRATERPFPPKLGPRMQCIACGHLTEKHRSGRCLYCRRATDSVRQRRRGVRYAGDHRQVRAKFAQLMASGFEFDCARCGKPIEQDTPWDLDHLPDGTRRPSHASCNRAATSRTASTQTGWTRE